jgi:hypothetical protein
VICHTLPVRPAPKRQRKTILVASSKLIWIILPFLKIDFRQVPLFLLCCNLERQPSKKTPYRSAIDDAGRQRAAGGFPR